MSSASTSWAVTLNGAPLNTEGSGVSVITGVAGIPSRDYYNQAFYANDGETSQIGGFNAGVFSITVWVSDNDRVTGAAPASGDEGVYVWENLAWLDGLLVTDYAHTVSLVVPGRSTLTEGQRTRVCQAQLFTASVPEWNEARTVATVVLGFKIPSVWWRAAPGLDGLDADGYRTVTAAAGVTSLTLPTNVYPMNGFIEDAIITVQNGANAIKTIELKSLNRGSGSLPPRLGLTTFRANGVLYANGKIVVDCKAHTVLHTYSSTTESVYKFADFSGGRPGSMLRIGPPYTVTAAFTPYTTGASMAAVTWSIKYRPSYI